jgi:peptide/nickel transport system substrate-binding protein
MDQVSKLARLLHNAAPTSRRTFLKRSAVMGVSIPVMGSLLAACGGDDDDGDDEDSPAATAVPTRVRSVPTTTTGQVSPATATPEADDDDDDEEEEPEAEPTATEEPMAAEPTATEEPDEADERQGGMLMALGHHEIASLSPDDWGPSVHFFIVGNIHDRLLKLDPFFTLQPSLSESFEVSDDGLTYTFNLRQGLTFHEGEPFTANDVKYTFDFRKDPENASVVANNFVSVDNVEAADDYTVVVNMLETNAAFVTLAGQTGIVSESYHSAIGEDAYKAAPNGLGPFKLVEWRAAEFTECEAFEDYWAGRPLLDGIREDIVPEASVRAIALETGEADTSVWALVTEDNVRFRDDPNFTTFVTSSVALNHFPMNNQHPVISEKNVRQAMMFAIDRDDIVDNLWRGLAVKATANLSPALDFYYEPDVAQYPYDPAMAEQLLEEAGWVMGSDGVREKDGVRCAFICTVISGDQARKPEAELAQQYLAQVGIEMSIEEAPVATIQEGQRNGTVDMSLYNWTYGGGSGEPDPSTVLKSGQRNNWSLWSNERVDELCDMGLEATDPEVRREIYSEIQKIVAEEVPFLFIKFWDWFTIFNPRIKGLPEDPLTADAIYQYAHTYWIEE